MSVRTFFSSSTRLAGWLLASSLTHSFGGNPAGIPRPGKSTGNWFPFLFYSRQFIEPCKQLEWDSKETEVFLGSLVDTCIKLDSLYTYV